MQGEYNNELHFIVAYLTFCFIFRIDKVSDKHQ